MDFCNWAGVACDRTGTITSLSMRSVAGAGPAAPLNASLPASLGTLTGLTHLCAAGAGRAFCVLNPSARTQ